MEFLVRNSVLQVWALWHFCLGRSSAGIISPPPDFIFPLRARRQVMFSQCSIVSRCALMRGEIDFVRRELLRNDN
jgi:hypothetical protein